MRTFPSRFSPVAFARATGRAVVLLLVAAYGLAPIDATAQFALRSTIEGTISDSTLERARRHGHAHRDDPQPGPDGDLRRARGLFFSNVAPGTYTVSAGAHRLHHRHVRAGHARQRHERQRVNLVLQVGGVTETVEVIERGPVISTDQIAIGVAVDKTLIDTISSKGRNFTSFVQLAPRHQHPAAQRQRRHLVGRVAPHHRRHRLRRRRRRQQRVLRQRRERERQLGGRAELLALTRGRRRDQGGRRELLGRQRAGPLVALGHDPRRHEHVPRRASSTTSRIESLNAWNPLEKLRVRQGTKKPTLNRHQFGGNIGGPVLRTSSFFFANYEQTYNRRGDEPEFLRVPTAAERQGDFSALLQRFPDDPNYVLYNPFSTVITEDGREHPRADPQQRPAHAQCGPTARRPSTRAPSTCSTCFPCPTTPTRRTRTTCQNFQAFSTSKFKSHRIDARVDVALEPEGQPLRELRALRAAATRTPAGCFPRSPTTSTTRRG